MSRFAITLWVTVTDPELLRQEAELRVEDDELMSLDEWRLMRGDGSRDPVKDDLQMLLDPGVSPDGCEIEGCVIEEVGID